MTTDQTVLRGVVYGEHLEGPQRRSLGYRLLAPAEAEPWCAEVEALARRLHAAPYPDHWPPTELFTSVLLADGQRLIAVARYGLADHTVSQRRGGLELIGVVGPGGLGVASALSVYHWLRQRRAAGDDLRTLGGRFVLSEVLTAVPPTSPPRESVPVLPIRLWQDGALLFAATAPSDSDQRLGLLEQGEQRTTWQWQPLVGADFPLQTYAQRGPLVAWTPHLAGVALKVDRKPAEETTQPKIRRSLAGTVSSIAILLLLIANLWATLDVIRRIPSLAVPASVSEAPRPAPTKPAVDNRGDDGRDAFALALYRLLQKQGSIREGNQGQLLGQYDRSVADDASLRQNRVEGKMAVGAVVVLARRSPRQVEEIVREALANKGYDPRLVELVCQRVHDRLQTDGKDTP
jgi:hypothetical protein